MREILGNTDVANNAGEPGNHTRGLDAPHCVDGPMSLCHNPRSQHLRRLRARPAENLARSARD
jgi:hypothetical protein